MSVIAKSALALAFVSVVAADECNGVDAGGITLPADVCLNAVQGGAEFSYEYTCEDDEGLYSVYYSADCAGDALFTNSTDDLGLNMTCGATDCDYALMASYSYNDTWGSSTTYSPWTTSTTDSMTTGSGTTASGTTASGTSSTSSGSTSSTSSGSTSSTDSGASTTWSMFTTGSWNWSSVTSDMETTEDMECSDYDFPNYVEIAYATGYCVEVPAWGAYAAVQCEDSTVYVGLYNDSDCGTLGFAFPLEGDGECDEVTCDNSVTTADPSETTDEVFETTDGDVDGGDGAASIDHLVALCFALIALVAGN